MREGATTTTSPKPSAPVHAPTPTSPITSGPRLAIVVEENHSFLQIFQSGDAPNLTALAQRGVLLNHMYATSHPSLPNYLALTSGSTHGATNDCHSCLYDGDNLFSQLTKAGLSWRVYAQGYAGGCNLGPDTGDFARRHVAALSYRQVTTNPALCANVVPFEQLARDLSAGTLPKVSLIIPDLDHDMHGLKAGTSPALVQAADTLVAQLDTQLTASTAWVPGSRLLITWDEGGGDKSEKKTACCGGRSHGGHIPTIILGAGLTPGTDAADTDHYDILRTIEDRLGLSRLGAAAAPMSHDIPAMASLAR
jgi:phospholipase C